MSIKKFSHVKIKGIEVVVPSREICIYDEAQYYDNSVKKIDRMRKMVGFYKRRVAEKENTPMDFAYNAANNLFDDMKIDRNSIDALIYVVQKPDWGGPVNSYFLHHKLGLSQSCIATDVVQGCAGWVFGLYMASQMIEAGTHKKILLLTYNAKLKIETREKIKSYNIKNMEAHSYHSFCVKYYDNKSVISWASSINIIS